MLVLFDGGVPIQKDLCTFLCDETSLQHSFYVSVLAFHCPSFLLSVIVVVRFAGVSSHGGALSVSVESDRLDSKDLLGQRIGIVAF